MSAFTVRANQARACSEVPLSAYSVEKLGDLSVLTGG